METRSWCTGGEDSRYSKQRESQVGGWTNPTERSEIRHHGFITTLVCIPDQLDAQMWDFLDLPQFAALLARLKKHFHPRGEGTKLSLCVFTSSGQLQTHLALVQPRLCIVHGRSGHRQLLCALCVCIQLPDEFLQVGAEDLGQACLLISSWKLYNITIKSKTTVSAPLLV